MLCLLYPSTYLSVKVESGGVGRYGWYGHDAKAQLSEAELVGLCSEREGPGEGGWGTQPGCCGASHGLCRAHRHTWTHTHR